MNRLDVRTPADALAYITDCTIATVCDMAMKKSRSKSEFNRQKEIAARAINWMREMGVDYSSTRAKDVDKYGSVDAWAETFIKE